MEKDNLNRDQLYLYEEIMTGLTQYIDSHGLKEGDRIPTEKELGDLFKASRISIRRAIKELVEEGTLKIVRGKGTFVSAPRKEIHLLDLQGFSEGLTTDNDTITKDIISIQRVDSNKDLDRIFDNQYDEYIELVRKVYRNDQALSLDYAYLPTALYPGIEKKITPESSTFTIIHDHYGVEFKKVNKNLEFVHPDEELQGHLKVNSLNMLILVDKVIYGEDNAPVHYSKYYLIAERVKLSLEHIIDQN
ncbi:GntR family transcriptional regulator [Rossellomorea arthrocnemi]|jgi:GntR family transcriptional regulator, frlABCD operon transcriptional regulator|uniref:GntR family transcriptional regulator n=1 Tax=Rossellomorea arthrocnemi TaxID=2769542 RepID=UPI00191A336B|nr:GntR family transcriptional regulator [Rossellomorea arthrocnemi]